MPWNERSERKGGNKLGCTCTFRKRFWVLNYVWMVLPRALLSRSPCPETRNECKGLLLQNRPNSRRWLVGFAAKTCSGSRESTVATSSYCSTTSLSILAVRVLGHLSVFLSTFPFYDWLVLGCKTLFQVLGLILALLFIFNLTAADSLTCGILARFGHCCSTRFCSFICTGRPLCFMIISLLLYSSLTNAHYNLFQYLVSLKCKEHIVKSDLVMVT